MKKMPRPFDWNQARAFLATAEEGSLSAAARLLGQRQPTLSRQVASLEQALDVVLFERVGRSLVLTRSGLELLEHFRSMGAAAEQISLRASGQSEAIKGRVTISTTNVLATYHLPPILREIKKQAPEIEVDIVATNELSDLMRREADIAIRNAKPEEPDLVASLVCNTTGHFYATRAYLEAVGSPQTVDQLSNAEFIGFERPERLLLMMEGLGISLTRDNVKFSSHSDTVYLALVKAGLGIGLLSKEIAKLTPDLTQVCPELNPIPIPIWLVAHRELHTSRRIRFVHDLIAEALPNFESTP